MQPPSSAPGAPVTDARRARSGPALALALACFAVLATHVHLGFERIRLRVVTAPQVAADRAITAPLPDLTPLAGAPAAIVARVRGGDEATRLTLALDGVALTTVEVAAHASTRVDASAVPGPHAGHAITVSGDHGGWRLDSLEIANVHGFSAGVVSFVIVPRGHPGDPRVPWWMAVLVGLALLALGTGMPSPEPRPGAERVRRVAADASAALVLVVFAGVLLADVVSPYRVLLAPATFGLLAAMLYMRPLLRAVPPIVSWTRRGAALVASAAWRAARAAIAFVRHRGWLGLVPHVAVAVLVLWGVAQFHEPGTGFTSMIRFGEAFSDRAVPALRGVPHTIESPQGYDAQFYAQLAFDPLLQDPATAAAIDTPFYRARRIFLPWLANVLALGEPWYVLQAYALLNVAAWLWLAWLLLRWLPPGSAATTAAWVACMLAHGWMASMARALADGPSVLLIALGIAAIQANRHWLGAGILGISGLTRETNLLAGTALLPAETTPGRGFLTVALRGLLVVAPLALWVGYLVSLRLPQEAAGTGNFAPPLVAYVDDWIAGVDEAWRYASEFDAWLAVLTTTALTTQAMALLWWRAWRDPWWRVGVGFALLMLVLGPEVWGGQPAAVTRVVLPMTVAFNVLLPRGRWFWPLWVLGNANLLHGPREMGLDWFLG